MSGFCFKRRWPARHRKGYIIIFGALILFFILVPAAGLAIDVGMMYLTQSLMSAASDGAALAGARALSRGSDDAAQRLNAETTANAYWHANFPTGYLWSTNAQVTSASATDSTYVRSITTTASVDLPLIFLRLLRVNSTTVTASSKATRRDANVMLVMDRSTSLGSGPSSACQSLKNAAKGLIDRFAEGRDNVGLITFGTSSRVDNALSTSFKTAITNTLTPLICSGATNTGQGLWQAYDALVELNQPGALNAILLFTDGEPTAVTATFPIKQPAPPTGSSCTDKNPKQGAAYTLSAPSNPSGLYEFVGLAQPMSSDLRVVTTGTDNCYFRSSQTNLYKDAVNIPLTDSSGNSLDATGYKNVAAHYNAGPPAGIAIDYLNWGAFNAADHAGLRIRRGDTDPRFSRSLPGVVIYTVGYNVDSDAETLLKRIANDPSLSPNPVAAGALGKYEFAGSPSDLNDAFTRVASEVLRLAR